MKKLIAGMALALAALGAWALPTLEQVENEVRLGHLTNAEAMMREVVTAKPGSARAHYIYAEVLARNGNFAAASEQARLARQADPQKFTAFESLLARQGASTASRTAARTPATGPADRAVAPPASGLPGWIWGALLAIAAVVLWRGFSRSRAGTTSGMAAGSVYGAPGAVGTGVGTGYAPYGSNPPYGPAGVPGARSGMLGAGLAGAGGFAAGMLADEVLHRHRDGGRAGALDNLGPSGLGPMASDPAAMDLESRPVDFGTGADWGGDSGAADAGSFDTGGGSDWS